MWSWWQCMGGRESSPSLDIRHSSRAFLRRVLIYPLISYSRTDRPNCECKALVNTKTSWNERNKIFHHLITLARSMTSGFAPCASKRDTISVYPQVAAWNKGVHCSCDEWSGRTQGERQTDLKNKSDDGNNSCRDLQIHINIGSEFTNNHFKV